MAIENDDDDDDDGSGGEDGDGDSSWDWIKTIDWIRWSNRISLKFSSKREFWKMKLCSSDLIENHFFL